MTDHDIALILYYRSTGKYALNVVADALEGDPALGCVPGDFPDNEEKLIQNLRIRSENCRQVVVGWSFYSPQFPDIAEQLARVKQRFHADNIIHLAGGVHATAQPEATLKAGFDFVAIGENEQIIVDVLNRLQSNASLHSVRGLAYLSADGMQRQGKGEYIELDRFAPCSTRYRKFGPIEITRGCVYGCRFCQTPFVNKARFRHRSIENIRHYAKIMAQNGLRDYRFVTPSAFSYGSDDNTVNLDAIETMLSAVRSAIGENGRIFYGSFPSEIRPEHISIKGLRMLKKYVSNDNIIVGGQSGSQRILDSCHRGHDVESIVTAVNAALTVGFKPNVDLLFGLPGETAEDAAMTVQLARHLTDLGAKIHCHSFMPLPGTPYQHENAAAIDQTTQQQLLSLVACGKVYGKWQG